MHELGILSEVVSRVEAVAKAHGSPRVEAIVLQVGEIATVIPQFLEECFPAAVYKTSLESARLELEIIPASGRCNTCEKVFSPMETKGTCPHCESTDFELLSGREFLIKEIIVED